MKEPIIRLLIAGSRTFDDYKLLKAKADEMLDGFRGSIQIISGGAQGADALAERYAKDRNLRFKCFPADWKRHGKSAGMRRNQQMADYCTHALIFWDGESRGTKDMIRRLEVPTEIVRYREIQQELELID